MARLLAYMLFDGDCASAMNFYQKTFGGRIEALTTVGESPMASQFPASSAHRVIHASLSFDGNTLMASDWMAPEPYPGIKGTRFTLTCQSVEEATRVFGDRLLWCGNTPRGSLSQLLNRFSSGAALTP